MNGLTELYELLKHQPVLTLFLIIGVGYLIGNIRIGSFSFGPVAGVLFASLFLGHFEFRMSTGAQAVGFALFIFSVGYQAGPRFFDVLVTDGLRYFVLALVIALCGFAVAASMASILSLEPGTSAGLLSGGLTSSPTLAAAQQAVLDGTISPPEGWSADQMVGNIATGYAITYIFGLAGLIATIKLLPGILGIDLVREAQRLEEEEAQQSGEKLPQVTLRAYRVTNEEVTKIPVRELRERFKTDFGVQRLFRDGERVTPGPDDFLQMDDVYVALDSIEHFTGELQHFGEEIALDKDPNSITQTARVTVIEKSKVGKSLGELKLGETYGVLLTQVRRMRLAVPISKNLVLRRGDILTVVGPMAHIELLGQSVGKIDQDVAETDMLTFAFGIVFGVLVGLISVKVGGVSIGLGSAGGLLSSGLLIGFIRSVHPTFGSLPDSARWILMELGLLIFMAGVGLRAGGNIIETFMQTGPKLVIAGILVTAAPVLFGYFFGRKVLKINPVLLLGAITGAMTSGASLSVVTSAAKSSVPALGYTGTYAFANVLLTVAGSIILLI